MRHRGISIDSVPYHGYLLRFQTMSVHDAVQHRRIRLAKHDVRFTACSMLDALLKRSAIHENSSLVRRTYTVRISGDIRNSLACPPCGTAKLGICQCSIEGYNKNIRNIVRTVSATFKSSLFELADHARSSDHEKSLRFRISLLNIIDSCQ